MVGVNKGLGSQIDGLKGSWNWYVKTTDAIWNYTKALGSVPQVANKPLAWQVQDLVGDIPNVQKLEPWRIPMARPASMVEEKAVKRKKGGAEKLWGSPDYSKAFSDLGDTWSTGGGAGMQTGQGVGLGMQGGMGAAAAGALGAFPEFGAAMQQSTMDEKAAERRIGYLHDIYDVQKQLKGLQLAHGEQQFAEAVRASNAVMAEKAELTQTFVVGPLKSFTTGLVQAGIAALEGSQGFGQAMANMLRSTLATIASEAAIRAMWEVAQALGAQGVTWGFPNTSSTNHWASAAMFGAVAVAAGAASAGIGAATRSSSSAGAGGGASYRNATNQSAGETYRPTYGKKSEKEAQNVTVQVYIGDSGDPGAILFATKQIEAKLAKAA
jgi:hypothetical protein